MKHELIKLPYALDALSPVMSQETLEYHYWKHHQAYVTKINELIAWTEYEEMLLEDIIKKSSGAIFNNAAQIWNHNFFWNSLISPTEDPITLPTQLEKHIIESFGDFNSFRQKFKSEALGRFWSGWVWLVQKWSTLSIYSSVNAENPLTLGWVTLLWLDVWEHSYYIDYRNDRGAFVDNFWKIVDWEKIESRLT